MREMKFRAWHPKGGDERNSCQMTYWKLGSGLDNSVFFNCAKGIMQFTGLLDKNGKEIYEGDIVNIGFRKITVVTYENGCFLAKYSNSNYRLGGWKVVEIIGNIYESPSLLTPNPIT